jgi:chromate transporter
VAQIALIRQELVEEEQWVSRERFNRVLGVYQILPGPEASELCIYFGMLSRGRLGGLMAGFGFVLPGFVLMLLLSWFYVRYGIASPVFSAAFLGMQAAVGALIVRAVHRIGSHVLLNRRLWGIAIGAAVAHVAGIHFLLILAVAGVVYLLAEEGHSGWASVLLGAGFVASLVLLYMQLSAAREAIAVADAVGRGAPSVLSLFTLGLRSGLLTFGGAYTAIPYLRNEAVVVSGWMTDSQFLDGLALAGILPAPLVIFGTFVGYLGGGFPGAIALTMGIYLPAFAITLLGHELLEEVVENKALHSFLDGVTAGVVGLIAVTALVLLRDAITGPLSLLIFAAGLFLLFRWNSKASVPVIMLGAALVGLLAYFLS